MRSSEGLRPASWHDRAWRPGAHRSLRACIARRIAIAVWASLLAASPAWAGALYLDLFATPAQAQAGAGAGAWANDASIALHNPAGMTRLNDHQAAGGMALLVSDIQFDKSSNPRGGGNGGQQGGLAPLPSAHYVHRISDRFRFGFSTFSLTGSVLDPSNDWAGRFEITDLTLLTLSFSPTLAVRVNDWLSIGGGPVVSYAKLDWKLRLRLPGPGGNEPNIRLDDMDDWKASGRVSILLHPSSVLQIGVLYQSETEFKLDGSLEISRAGDRRLNLGFLGGRLGKDRSSVTTSLDLQFPLPQFVHVGTRWQTTEDLALLLTLGWEDWSVFDDLSISTSKGGTSYPARFRDTYKIGVGAQYQLTDDWLLQAGVAYDTSPLQNKDRITALPLDAQIRGSVGTLYDLSESFQLGLSFAYVNLGRSKVRTANVRGDYERNQLFVFSVSLGFKKLPWSGKATL